MAMRQRSGGVTATLPRHEDFQPKSERKEEAAATVIVIHLPGFVKERIKIAFVQSPRILRVNGERPIQDNRWSRFNEAFPVPENCEVDKIDARFLQGILTITMPKNVISQLRPAGEAKTIQNPTSTPNSTADQPKPQEVAEEIPPPEPTSAKTAPQKAPSPPKLVAEPKLQKEIFPEYTSPLKPAVDPKTQKVQEQIPSTSGFEKRRDEKATTEPKSAGDIPSTSTSTSIEERQRVAWRSQEATTEPKAQKGQDATPPKAASTTTDTQKQMDIDQKSIEKKDKLVKENGKDKGTNEFERVVERNKAKGKEAVQKIAESVMAEKAFLKNIVEKKKGSAETGIRQKGKNLANKKLNEEEKQNLINVGAAVLVIVALGFGVYASYRYSSSGKPKK
ncbi:hypothetical protein FH972_010462 [Carpinus fangiana]|uniref:SHSP domain-containing protein n=1 Tax=Carpinus fangiana TaxID=176857 RepID=A0A660KQE4_9ROSI|nr:hypothetical protein FH972_010462 [Carpinus fangiana]